MSTSGVNSVVPILFHQAEDKYVNARKTASEDDALQVWNTFMLLEILSAYS
jgi:hypothetical protein